MSVEDVFHALQQALDSTGIPYMLTGSFASSARDQLIALIPKFPAGKYHTLEFEALDAFDRRSMFNAMT